MDRVDWLPWLLRAIGAGAAVVYGHVDPVIWLLVAVMALDILSGLLAGGRNGELNSSVSFHGMRKKAMMLLLVGLGSLVETRVPVPIAVLVAGAFAATEAISILENAGRLGVPIPAVLTDALERLGGDQSQGGA